MKNAVAAVASLLHSLVNFERAGMDQSKGQSHGPDFSFAFNDSNYSDRMLEIQVLPDSEGDGWNDGMLHLITDCRSGNEDGISFFNSNMILAI